MDVTISSRHTKVSEKLENVTREKIGRLDKYLEGLDRAKVHFSEHHNPRIADKEVLEVSLEGHGHHVRCKVAAPDGYRALDLAVAKLERQLRKLKTKVNNRNHGGVKHDLPPVLRPSQAAAIPQAERQPTLVKVKQFELQEMTAQEAIVELDIVGHDFYYFIDSHTGRTAVLYVRDDGDYGLIEQAA